MASKAAAADKAREWPLSALVFTALTIGLLACLANLLNFHHYPALRAETAIVGLALLGIAALATGLHRLAQPRLSFLFAGLFAAVLFDLGTSLGPKAFPISTGLFMILAWWRERVLLKLTIAAFASVLLFQTADLLGADGTSPPAPNEAKRLQARTAGQQQLRPIIHLVLDSYIGLDGMTAAGTHFGDLRQQQEAFYLDHGFQLFPGAYSRHAKTINALPEFLSYGRAPRATEPRNVQETVAPPLAWFEDLDRAGYRTSAAAPSFVDLCPNQPLSLCRNYNRSDLSDLARAPLSAGDKALVIGTTMLGLSQFTEILSGTIDRKLQDFLGGTNRRLYNRAKLYSLTGLSQMDAFTRDLATLKMGEARFVHLLLPHDPYLLDAACKLLPEAGWGDEHGPLSLASRDQAYSRQTRCVTEQRVAALLKALDATHAGREAIVIIQGDHGSRTLDGVPSSAGGTPDARTLAVTYSAFFAVRMPGQQAGQVKGQFALDQLLGTFAASRFSAPPRPELRSAEVWLMNDLWIPDRKIALPPFAQKF